MHKQILLLYTTDYNQLIYANESAVCSFVSVKFHWFISVCALIAIGGIPKADYSAKYCWFGFRAWRPLCRFIVV